MASCLQVNCALQGDTTQAGRLVVALGRLGADTLFAHPARHFEGALQVRLSPAYSLQQQQSRRLQNSLTSASSAIACSLVAGFLRPRPSSGLYVLHNQMIIINNKMVKEAASGRGLLRVVRPTQSNGGGVLPHIPATRWDPSHTSCTNNAEMRCLSEGRCLSKWRCFSKGCCLTLWPAAGTQPHVGRQA